MGVRFGHAATTTPQRRAASGRTKQGDVSSLVELETDHAPCQPNEVFMRDLMAGRCADRQVAGSAALERDAQGGCHGDGVLEQHASAVPPLPAAANRDLVPAGEVASPSFASVNTTEPSCTSCTPTGTAKRRPDRRPANSSSVNAGGSRDARGERSRRRMSGLTSRITGTGGG